MLEIIAIKIRGNLVAFNEDDRFMDNGACVRCLTIDGSDLGHGGYGTLKLTKKAIREIDVACERVSVPSDYADFVKIFKLRLRA